MCLAIGRCKVVELSGSRYDAIKFQGGLLREKPDLCSHSLSAIVLSNKLIFFNSNLPGFMYCNVFCVVWDMLWTVRRYISLQDNKLCQIKAVNCWSCSPQQDGDKFWRMPECYIRGSTIKYLRIPDEIIDMVKEEVVSKGRGRGGSQQNKMQGKGRGGGGGRGEREKNPVNQTLCCYKCL